MIAHPHIPFNDLRRLYARYGSLIEPEILSTLRSGWWLNGPRVNAFSKLFSAEVGVRHCIAVANGTDALEIALRALTIDASSKRSEVITVANAGGYTTTAALNAGLIPIYCDIDEATQLVCIESAVSCLSEATLAIVATHLYGGVVNVVDLRAAMMQAGFGNIPIIEDCSQAHGGRNAGQYVGSIGDLATFSFYPTKNLGALGDAGAIMTDCDELARTANRLRQYGWSTKYSIDTAGGRNSRMDELQAAALSVLLRYLSEMNSEKAKIAAAYRAANSGSVDFVEGGEGRVTHLIVTASDHRDALKMHLKSRNIDSEIHYPILDCDQPAWKGRKIKIAPTGLDVSRRSVSRILSLPCYVGMTAEEIDHVSTALGEFDPK